MSDGEAQMSNVDVEAEMAGEEDGSEDDLQWGVFVGLWLALSAASAYRLVTRTETVGAMVIEYTEFVFRPGFFAVALVLWYVVLTSAVYLFSRISGNVDIEPWSPDLKMFIPFYSSRTDSIFPRHPLFYLMWAFMTLGTSFIVAEGGGYYFDERAFLRGIVFFYVGLLPVFWILGRLWSAVAGAVPTPQLR